MRGSAGRDCENAAITGSISKVGPMGADGEKGEKVSVSFELTIVNLGVTVIFTLANYLLHPSNLPSFSAHHVPLRANSAFPASPASPVDPARW